MTIGDPSQRRPPRDAAAATRTGSGRRLGSVDHGTVALAIGGMAMYWLMPALLSRGRKGRRVVRPARRARPGPPPDRPETPQP